MQKGIMCLETSEHAAKRCRRECSITLYTVHSSKYHGEFYGNGTNKEK